MKTRLFFAFVAFQLLQACMLATGLHDDSDAKNILDFSQSFSTSSGACSQKYLAAYGYPSDPSKPNTVYSYVRTNCSACHGSTQAPKFAVQDGQSSYSASLPYVNFTNPSASIFYSRSKDGHCGGACSQDGNAMLASIQNWINDEKAAKNDPACSGNGIKLRVNNALSDQVSASQMVNACVGYEIVSVSAGVVANPASDLDITLSGAPAYSDAACMMPAASVKLLKTQSSVKVYVMEAAAPITETLLASIAGSSVKVDLTINTPVAPTATPAPTSTPRPTNTPMPTSTPGPTPTPGGATPTPTPVPTATPTPTPAGVACTTIQRQNAYKNTLWPVVMANCGSCHTTGSQPRFGSSTLSTAYSNAISRININTTTSSKIYTKGRDGHCGGTCSSSMGATLLNQINAWVPAEKSTNCSSLGALVQ